MDDFSLKSCRRKSIYDSLAFCDSDKDKLALMVDRYIQLQDALLELQDSYLEILSKTSSVFSHYVYQTDID